MVIPGFDSAPCLPACHELRKPKNLEEECLLLHQLESLNDRNMLNTYEYMLRRRLLLRQEQRSRKVPVMNLREEQKFIAENKRSMTSVERLENEKRLVKLEPEPERQPYLLEKFRAQNSDLVQEYLHIFRTEGNGCCPFEERLQSRNMNDLHSDTDRIPRKTLLYPPFKFRPLKVRLLQEIRQHNAKKNPDTIPENSEPLFYFMQITASHIPAINRLACEHFWKEIDMSYALENPKTTCVVQYGDMVVGFGVVIPDVTISESYISFLFVHPEFRLVGIGKAILYHLISYCPTRSISLHISPENHAFFLFKKFGFQKQELVRNFYDQYFRYLNLRNLHAIFMKLVI